MLQLNSKELKDFRDALALWHIADFDKKDAQITRQKKIRLNNAKIEEYNTDIEKLQAGTTKPIGKSVDERVAEIQTQIKVLEDENKDAMDIYTKHADSLDDNFAAGRKLVSDELVKSLENYLDDIYNDDAESEVLDAIVKFFTNNGAKGVVVDDVRKYLRPIGRKWASAKQSLESGKHTSREKGTKLKDSFLGGLCDDEKIATLLPEYKWLNKIEKKGKKGKKSDK